MNPDQLDARMREALDARLPSEGAYRLQQALDEELQLVAQAPPRPVMTLTEVAHYLRVTPEVIDHYLDDIPCFELGGRILFRREAVDAWIAEREQRLSYQIFDFDLNTEANRRLS